MLGTVYFPSIRVGGLATIVCITDADATIVATKNDISVPLQYKEIYETYSRCYVGNVSLYGEWTLSITVDGVTSTRKIDISSATIHPIYLDEETA